jgi:hypothetical protein
VLDIAQATSGSIAGTFYLATTRGLLRKTPGGSWTRQTPDASYIVNDVEVDPTCQSRVYAALGFAGHVSQHRGGVLRSSDGGTTFESITSGLDIHQALVANIQVDPANARYLYAGVFERGFWIYDAGPTPGCP